MCVLYGITRNINTTKTIALTNEFHKSRLISEEKNVAKKKSSKPKKLQKPNKAAIGRVGFTGGNLTMRADLHKYLEKLEDGVNLVEVNGQKFISVSAGLATLGPQVRQDKGKSPYDVFNGGYLTRG